MAMHRPLALLGTLMLIPGFGFKFGMAPFHMWTPDVYEGAPAPVTTFLATVSKGAVLALLLRYVIRVGRFHGGTLFAVIATIAAVSMFADNLLALLQNNVKRILAYSSIAHMGYLLVAFLTPEQRAVEAVSYYLATYFIATLGVFGIVGLLSFDVQERTMLIDYRALFWERPWIAGAFTAMLLSLSSIPLTAGFIGKFYILGAGVKASLWFLAIVIVLNSAIGLFYYLRIIVTLYSPPEKEPTPTPSMSHSMPGAIALGILTLLLLWLGIYPSPVVELVHAAALGLT
jgi:NADH-quinone oxidoreductase subunit N